MLFSGENSILRQIPKALLSLSVFQKNDNIMQKKLFAVADIGGTNGRFAIFAATGNGLELAAKKWVPTSRLADTKDILAAFTKWESAEISPDTHSYFGNGASSLDAHNFAAIVIAIAGPVGEGRGCLSNACLEIDLRRADIPCHARLVNDFEVQAWACMAPCGQNARLIAGPDSDIHETRAVIGAGTGLGVAALLPDRAGWRAIPSEAGHMNFPFVGKKEEDFHSFLCSRLDLRFARGDDTITGRGLAILHEYLTGERIGAREVGEKALQSPTPTLEWYSRFYARACRNWMLATLCNGGLWIAGGIAAQNPLTVTSPFFMAELYNAPEEYLQKMPVRLIEDKDSGLWGGAWLATQIARVD